MAELADAPDLGSGGEILVGSSPSPGISPDLERTALSAQPSISFLFLMHIVLFSLLEVFLSPFPVGFVFYFSDPLFCSLSNLSEPWLLDIVPDINLCLVDLPPILQVVRFILVWRRLVRLTVRFVRYCKLPRYQIQFSRFGREGDRDVAVPR